MSRRRRRTAFDALETIALVGAIGLILSPALKGITYRWRLQHPKASSDAAIDEALDETFPASDPPASRFVDIPENRKPH